MSTCPQCAIPLNQTRDALGFVWRCPACGGQAVALAVLRKSFMDSAVNEIWQGARLQTGIRGRACPECGQPMEEVRAAAGHAPVNLEVCHTCTLVWFDAREWETLPTRPPVPPKPELPQRAREALAMVKVEQLSEQRQAELATEAPDGIRALPALLGLPVEVEDVGTASPPWLTWALTAVITLVSLYVLYQAPELMNRFAFIPAQALRFGGITLLSSFFLHGGLLHLLGNMYFLIVFGNNVEDRVGRLRFAVLLALATLIGNLAHLVGDPRGDLPCIGSSGGIAGVMAYYALAFPKARFAMFFRFSWVRIPAYAYILFWVGLQFLGAWQQIHGFSDVSALAHLGGAAAGLGCWVCWRRGNTSPES